MILKKSGKGLKNNKIKKNCEKVLLEAKRCRWRSFPRKSFWVSLRSHSNRDSTPSCEADAFGFLPSVTPNTLPTPNSGRNRKVTNRKEQQQGKNIRFQGRPFAVLVTAKSNFSFFQGRVEIRTLFSSIISSSESTPIVELVFPVTAGTRPPLRLTTI